jgi:hypothetical protein
VCIIKSAIRRNTYLSCADRILNTQMLFLVLEHASGVLDEHVVTAATFVIHANADIFRLQHRYEFVPMNWLP